MTLLPRNKLLIKIPLFLLLSWEGKTGQAIIRVFVIGLNVFRSEAANIFIFPVNWHFNFVNMWPTHVLHTRIMYSFLAFMIR